MRDSMWKASKMAARSVFFRKLLIARSAGSVIGATVRGLGGDKSADQNAFEKRCWYAFLSLFSLFN